MIEFSQGSSDGPRFSSQWYSCTAAFSWPRGAESMPIGNFEKSSWKSSSPLGAMFCGVWAQPRIRASVTDSENVLIGVPPSAKRFQDQPVPAPRDAHRRRRHEPPLVRRDLARLDF